MYKFLDKYKTNKKIPARGIISGRKDWETSDREIIIQLNEYEFKFGEILNEFLNHKNRFLFKIFHYSEYKFRERVYIEILNNVGNISHGL